MGGGSRLKLSLQLPSREIRDVGSSELSSWSNYLQSIAREQTIIDRVTLSSASFFQLELSVQPLPTQI